VKPVPTGLQMRHSFDVTDADTAAAIGNPGIDAVSTMTLVRLIEEACWYIIQPYSEEGDATVGTRIALDHIAAAFPGRPVDISATLASTEGRRLNFEVVVCQDDRTVMTGTHQRAIVSLERFLGKTMPTSAGLRPQVEFWFDVHSPWCYLASYRIGNIVRSHNGVLSWRPLHLANLIDAIDGRRPLEENAAFVQWYNQDLKDQAALLGLPLYPHPDYPLRPSRALRASLYAEERGCAEVFVQSVMRAYWAEQRDISDVGVLRELADDAGLNGSQIEKVVDDERYKQTIVNNNAEAKERDVFGVPTAIFQGKLFFGSDHLNLLDRWVGAWRNTQTKREDRATSG